LAKCPSASVIARDNEDTPLHLAALRGKLPAVKYLITGLNVDPNIKGQYGQTPLHNASIMGREGAVKYLVSLTLTDIMAEDDYFETPICLAAKKGHTSLREYLSPNKKN